MASQPTWASSGAARLFWIASASLPRIGAGVPFGTRIPYQAVAR